MDYKYFQTVYVNARILDLLDISPNYRLCLYTNIFLNYKNIYTAYDVYLIDGDHNYNLSINVLQTCTDIMKSYSIIA